MPSLKWVRSEGRPEIYPIFKKITAIGRAASKGVVHRNTAARYISRITRAVNAASAS